MRESILKENAERLVEWLQEMMTTSYGGLFTSRVASTDALERWERLWKVALIGKDPYRTKQAFATLFGLYSEVFGCADFNKIYRETPGKNAGQRSLPKPRADKERALAALKEARESIDRLTDGTGIRRSRANIASGKWTPEMEERYRAHAAVVGYRL